jgi:hypothetical protein
LTSFEDLEGNKFAVVFDTAVASKDEADLEGDDDEEGGKMKRILLQAPNIRVKGKWMQFLGLDLQYRAGGAEQLIVEGAMMLSKASFTSNGHRWIRITERLIEINKDEEGEVLYAILLSAVAYVDVTKDKKEIKLDVIVGTKTISFLLKAKTEREKNKWCGSMQRVFPHEKLSGDLEMCPYMESY